MLQSNARAYLEPCRMALRIKNPTQTGPGNRAAWIGNSGPLIPISGYVPFAAIRRKRTKPRQCPSIGRIEFQYPTEMQSRQSFETQVVRLVDIGAELHRVRLRKKEMCTRTGGI